MKLINIIRWTLDHYARERLTKLFFCIHRPDQGRLITIASAKRSEIDIFFSSWLFWKHYLHILYIHCLKDVWQSLLQTPYLSQTTASIRLSEYIPRNLQLKVCETFVNYYNYTNNFNFRSYEGDEKLWNRMNPFYSPNPVVLALFKFIEGSSCMKFFLSVNIFSPFPSCFDCSTLSKIQKSMLEVQYY